MSRLKHLLNWLLVNNRDLTWLLAVALVIFGATHRPPESDAALIKVDDRDYFQCPESGCWWKVRDATSWAELARRIKADPEQLRADNPQASRDVLKAGQLIRLREGSEAAH